MIRVTKTGFSGVPNPVWEITDPVETEKLLKKIRGNSTAITTVANVSRDGFVKLILENHQERGADTSAADLPATFYVNDGYAQDTGASTSLSALILDAVGTLEMTEGDPRNPKATTQKIQYNTGDPTRRDDQGPYTHSSPANPNGQSTVQFAKYNPNWWNTGHRTGNNCYAYACNVRTDGIRSASYIHPGYCFTGKVPGDDGDLLNGVRYDGLTALTPDTKNPVRGTADNPAWLVYLVSGYPFDHDHLWDYHWYRKVWSGNGNTYYWASKAGPDPVKFIVDAPGALEADAKKRGYETRHGYYAIYRNIVCGGT